jgi:hypothetical protein
VLSWILLAGGSKASGKKKKTKEEKLDNNMIDSHVVLEIFVLPSNGK